MNDVIKGALATLLLLLAFWLGRITTPEPPTVSERVSEVTEVVRDTVIHDRPMYVYKEVRDSIPYAVTKIVRDTVTLCEVVTVRDTVWLPKEVKVYEDSLYRAEVSGYMPNLDRIDIYAPTKIVTIEKEREIAVKAKSRWGLGVQVGYGVTVQKQPEFRPYIGVGVSYNFLSW